MSNSLNDIFAHLDSAKASRAYEANQERRRKVEEAEHERKVKQAAESAVEKYHVYDDDYDVEDVEEPLVMIPKQNPGTPEAKAATMPASKKDMDDIADNNPFVQNLFKRSQNARYFAVASASFPYSLFTFVVTNRTLTFVIAFHANSMYLRRTGDLPSRRRLAFSFMILATTGSV